MTIFCTPQRGRPWLVPLLPWLAALALTGSLLLPSAPALAQTAPNLDRVEYFLDTDPGYGLATAVTLPGGTTTTAANLTIPVSIASSAPGFHALYIRSRSGGSLWSQTLRQLFYVDAATAATAPNLNRIEYFLDTDPGYGLGTAATLTGAASANRTQTFAVPLGAVAAGFHSLYYRSRDVNGGWSQTGRQLFYVDDATTTTAPALVKAEFYVDTDPGYGAATAVPIGGGVTNATGVSLVVPLGSLAVGFHRLFIRTLDANGKWSQTTSQLFYLDDLTTTTAPALVKAEFYLDTDPGYGAATAVPIGGGATNAPSVNLVVPLGAVAVGFHRLFIRTLDASGKWSETFNRLIYVDDFTVTSSTTINKAEYYFDTDPGYGSGVNVPISTPAPDLPSLNLLADASALADGSHRLFVRTRDANNKWSLVLSRTFAKSSCAVSDNFAADLPSASYGSNFNQAEAVAVFNGTGTAGFYNNYYVNVDLGASTRTVSEVQFGLRNLNGNAVNYTVQTQTSPDGSTYTTVNTVTATLAANQASAVLVQRPLAPVQANVRYVRLLFTSASSIGSPIQMTSAGVYYFNCVVPTITQLNPTSGPVGTSVTITGTNLTGASAVRFNGTLATTFSAVSATSVTATVPAGATTGTVSITTPNGTAVSTGSFTVSQPVPTVTGLNPTSGPVGTSVTITGTGFATTTAVKFNGTNAPGFSVNGTGTTLTVNVPGGATTGTVSVTSPGGTGTSSGTFTVIPPPTITTFTPTSGVAGASVTINGTNLTGATGLTFNGTAATILTNTGTAITTMVPAGATSGVIQVTTVAGTGTSSTSFTVTTPNSAPTALGLSPQNVNENTAGGTAIGNFSTTDADAGNTHTYTLVAGTGSTDNAAFSISGNQLVISSAPNFEVKPSYAIRARTTDQGGLTFEQTFTITVTNVNEAPAISAQTRSIAENSANGTAVGAALTATDPDAGTTLTYSITAGNTGGAFSFGTGGQLQVANMAALDFETTPTFTLTVQVSDGSLTTSNTVTVNLTDVVEGAPAAYWPTSGAPGSVVLITGTGYSATTVARFNGAAATGTGFNSATSLTATVPVGATTGSLTTQTGGGAATPLGTYTVLAGPAPRLTQFTPLRAPVGTVLTLFGSGFTGATAVRFGAVNAPGFVVISATQLTVPVPAGVVSGTRLYVLTGQGAAQSARAFTLIPPPTLSALFPTYGTAQAVVQLTGTNLTNATEVSFNGTEAPAYTVNSATSITATIPIGATTGPISVTTVAGTATTAGAFTVNASPAAPSISGFTPASGNVGTAVTVAGTSLGGASQVLFGATAGTVGSASAGAVTTSVPTGAATGYVWVLTAGGLAQSPAKFTVSTPAPVVPAPALTSLLPAFGTAGARVIVKGTNLSGATAVTVNGAAATFTAATATGLTATVPAGATSGLLRVTTAGGQSNGLTFTVNANALPTLTGFTPTSGPVGQVVTVTGTNFTGATQAVLNGVAGPITVQDANTATFTVPTGATSGLVGVIGTGGLMLSATPFTVVPAPVVTSFSPGSGSTGTSVTVTGQNFTGATSVRFGGVAAVMLTVHSATSLTATVPVLAATGPISVTTAGGTGASAASFTVTPSAPTITSLAPTSGILGTWVTLTGTNLTGTTAVRFNGKPAESYQLVSAIQVLAQVPDGATTGRVTVLTGSGEGASTTPFTVTIAPDIDAFTPVRGPVGTVVTLTGEGFTGATALTVGGVAASMLTAQTDKRLTVTIPNAALSGQLRLTTPVAVGVSAQSFTVTGMRVDSSGVFSGTTAARLGLYPNPAAGTVTVWIDQWPTGVALPPVELFDALGRRLRAVRLPDAITATSAPVSLLGVPAGVYLVRCGGLTQRLVVE